MTAIRDALAVDGRPCERWTLQCRELVYLDRSEWCYLCRARAELDALEAVAEAAHVVAHGHPAPPATRIMLSEDMPNLVVALARLAAVRDGQTRGDGHESGGAPDATRASVDTSETSTGGVASPRVCPCRVHGDAIFTAAVNNGVSVNVAACPCRVHGDPDGDCGERCA